MKDIVESIKKTNYSEWHDVKCIKEYKIERKTCRMTFKQGEEYEASKINDNINNLYHKICLLTKIINKNAFLSKQ